jgi:hypothetical protein
VGLPLTANGFHRAWSAAQLRHKKGAGLLAGLHPGAGRKSYFLRHVGLRETGGAGLEAWWVCRRAAKAVALGETSRPNRWRVWTRQIQHGSDVRGVRRGLQQDIEIVGMDGAEQGVLAIDVTVADQRDQRILEAERAFLLGDRNFLM